MNDSTVVIIPARMGSRRFPGKPMATILGKPMLHWVIRHAVEAVGVARTFVASCDQEILDFAQSEHIDGIPTLATHERASDRTSEAVEILKSKGHEIAHVLMLQGDEPTIVADDILRAIEATESARSHEIVNLMGKIQSQVEWEDPNTIKVVVDKQLNALYLTRTPVPYGPESGWENAFKQVCAIGFSAQSLAEFSDMIPHSLEEVESIDMLRWLANGRTVRMVPITSQTQPVDVVADLPIVTNLLKSGRGTQK